MLRDGEECSSCYCSCPDAPTTRVVVAPLYICSFLHGCFATSEGCGLCAAS